LQDAYVRLIAATQAGADLARPGKTAADLFHAMNDVLSKGAQGTDAGRLGHGLGMSLTEWPSLIPTDHTQLEAGMILTLEPGIAVGDKIIVHEENIVITETGPIFLSPQSSVDMPII
jgi:Xaa-Pro aminopeptidase